LTERGELRNWLFKGLAVEATLDGLEADGVAIRASTDPRALQRLMPLEDFSPTIRRASMKALPAYLAFFCLENSVRELVQERLAENHGPEWWVDCASSPIKTKVTDRQQQEGAKRWHVRRGEHEIYYTDFGDLKNLIRNNWADFEDVFPDQNWVSTRLDELEASRNVIAHSNLLDDREMQRISLYLQDWSRQVG
jgi:Swt1-like HEPN